MTTHSSGDIAAAERHLATRTLPDGEEAQVMSISRTYDGEVAEIWDVVTNPERLPRWFLPVSGDLRVGGRFRIEGNAEGEVLTCEPPQAFSATWEYGGDVSWIEVELAPVEGGRTRLQLRHVARPNEHWKQYGPGAVGIGWDAGLLGLAMHLADPAAPRDQAAIEAWMVSDEGKLFYRLSSDSWAEAAIANGTDPAVARERADRCYAAYTGS